MGVARVNSSVTRGKNSMAGFPRTTNQSLILTIISISVQITHEKFTKLRVQNLFCAWLRVSEKVFAAVMVQKHLYLLLDSFKCTPIDGHLNCMLVRNASNLNIELQQKLVLRSKMLKKEDSGRK